MAGEQQMVQLGEFDVPSLGVEEHMHVGQHKAGAGRDG